MADEEIKWTKSEMKEFDRLSWQSCSRDQVERIKGRLDLKAFVIKHGKEKCDAMWADIQNKEPN